MVLCRNCTSLSSSSTTCFCIDLYFHLFLHWFDFFLFFSLEHRTGSSIDFCLYFYFWRKNLFLVALSLMGIVQKVHQQCAQCTWTLWGALVDILYYNAWLKRLFCGEIFLDGFCCCCAFVELLGCVTNCNPRTSLPRKWDSPEHCWQSQVTGVNSDDPPQSWMWWSSFVSRIIIMAMMI